MLTSFNSFFVNSYPRSGNTWMRLLLIDALSARSLDLNPIFSSRFGIFNTHSYSEISDRHHSGWIFKSHLMYDHIPQELSRFKGLYLVRDGRDSLVSYYFYNVKHKKYTESWDEFFKRYFELQKASGYREKVLMKHMGFWAENVASYRNADNAMIIKYEDLLQNPMKITKSAFEFLEIPFQEYESNLQYLFNKASDDLLQKKQRDEQERKRGSTGAWQDFFSSKQNELFITRSGEILSELGYL